jgi:hypothetical protein
MTIDEMRAKLRYAQDRLADAQEAKARADRLSEQAREMGGGIPGFGGSGSQRAARAVSGAQGRAFAAHIEADERITLWTGKIASLEHRIAEAERVLFTSADLTGATHVRNGIGWHRIVKINEKSVTVETPYSWTDRIPMDQVREFRTIPAAVTL